jgi:hypothetical protein
MALLVIRINVAIEVPNEDSIFFSNAENLCVVSGIESQCIDWIRMADEALEVIRD